jgi:hypothetical protein
MTRRLFLKVATWLSICVTILLSKRAIADFPTQSNQPLRYGRGAYGEGPYPAKTLYSIFTPIIIKEGD